MRTLPFAIIIGIALGLYSCEPSPSTEELTRDLLVQTDYDNSVDFKSYNTYTFPLDTLGLISNNISDTLILTDYAKKLTAEIKLNMDARGYNYVAVNQDPDLGINAFIVNDFNVFQTISYPSYYGGYYSPYYGYYYPIVNTYASNSAILILQLVDFNEITSQGQFKVIWTCYIGDLLVSPDPTQQSVEGIAQAFAQSQIIGK
jgi:hypothetical protein